MIQKPFAGRASIHQDFNGLTIEIPSKRHWFVIIFMMIWLGGWLMGELFALKMILTPNFPIFANIFILVWLIGWTIGGAFVIYNILWQLIGREIILVEHNLLTIEKSVKGVGRKRQYEIASIQNMDINPVADRSTWNKGKQSPSPFGTNTGKIKFDYGMKTIKFASEIDEAEARKIIQKFKDSTYFEKENFGRQFQF